MNTRCHYTITSLEFYDGSSNLDVLTLNLMYQIYPDILLSPRTGNLVQALHVFNYPEINNVNDLAFNTCYQHVTGDKNIQSKIQAMTDLYVDAGK